MQSQVLSNCHLHRTETGVHLGVNQHAPDTVYPTHRQLVTSRRLHWDAPEFLTLPEVLKPGPSPTRKVNEHAPLNSPVADPTQHKSSGTPLYYTLTDICKDPATTKQIYHEVGNSGTPPEEFVKQSNTNSSFNNCFMVDTSTCSHHIPSHVLRQTSVPLQSESLDATSHYEHAESDKDPAITSPNSCNQAERELGLKCKGVVVSK